MLDQGSEKNQNQYDEPQIKIVMLGNEISGKTSIAQRFTQETFSIQYEQTLGLDFYSKRVNLSGDVSVDIQIWDIGGQAINNRMIANYLYGAQAILLCYDVTHTLSFQNLEKCLNIVNKILLSKQSRKNKPYIACVGNKIDLFHMQTVSKEMHETFISNNKLNGFYVSAKTGENVNNMFLQITSNLLGITYYRKHYDSKSISKAISKGDSSGISNDIINNSDSKTDNQCLIS
ncbi:P-loop containing nucleoside triphosphate hydrolase protein [Piromyces finnis]|uniref:p-loop containing nucleoside triphosphate hydrolase protein n=1 Tax=Piromyces finnis TaxID=1754191 RepID=A0A1Y1VFC2_9FUNG|nr:P-loop containing nucleoside triphosphate hydrolase protein [Piromyces finnis]|eukprot:ORX54803.1 P-loop containing nucleoside triphosphate hydrolase protein [Piromyces finnis]